MKFRDLVPWRTSSEKVPSENMATSLATFQREMNRMFEDFFGGASQMSLSKFFQEDGRFSPKINVEESDNRILVKAELPGMEEKDIRLSLKDDHLVLEGERKSEEERTEGGTRYYESSFGKFRRVVPFYSEVDADKVDASMKKGVLTIVIPKVPSGKSDSRKISIRPE